MYKFIFSFLLLIAGVGAFSTQTTVHTPLSEQERDRTTSQQEPSGSSKRTPPTKIELEAINLFNGMLLKGSVDLEKIEKTQVKVLSLLDSKPDSSKINMVALQLWEMKTKLLPTEHKDREIAVIAAAQLARKMATFDDVPARLKNEFAPHIARESKMYAKQGKLKLAQKTLIEAAELGFDDYEEVESDPDFQNLRGDQHFNTFFSELVAIVDLRLKNETTKELDSFEPFEFDFQLELLDGKPVSLEDYRGKILIIDFWGTWCPPCIEELPILNALQKTYLNDDKVSILGFAFERGRSKETNIAAVKDCLERIGVELDTALITRKIQKQVPEFRAYPTKLVIDTTGQVRWMMPGKTSRRKLKSVVSLLQQRASDRQKQ